MQITRSFINKLINKNEGVVNVLDCEIIVREFEFQSGYCVHFWISTRGKGINPLIPAAIG